MEIHFKGLTVSVITLILLFITSSLWAQTDSTAPVTVTGYLETYYGLDPNNRESHTRPNFLYSHNKTNEFSVNLAYIKVAYLTKQVRANIALAAGAYMNANYSAEQGSLKNIYEADAGIRLSKNDQLWIDAGIMPSHIGFESAVGKDCWTLTRSLLAENSPYFETGARLSYTSRNQKWYLAALLLNGWQHIDLNNSNKSLSLGHQVTFKPNDKLLLNSSSFIGNDKPDSIYALRLFHDLYMQYQISRVFGLTAGFDIGMEQISKGSKGYNTWYSPILIGRFTLSGRSALALRGEYYQDKNGILISVATPGGFRTFGYSINYDLSINNHVLWRVEIRNFNSKTSIFQKNGRPENNDLFFTSSLAIAF